MRFLTPLAFALVLGFSSLAVTAAPLERGAYDSAGKLTALMHDGAELAVRAGWIVSFDANLEVVLQPHDQRSPITREGNALKWKGTTTFPNSASAEFTAAWTESPAATAVSTQVNRTAGFPLQVKGVDYVIDIPREAFVGGVLQPAGTRLTATKPADPVFYRGQTRTLTVVDAKENWTLQLDFDREYPVTVSDRWDAAGRSYRVRVTAHTGSWGPEPITLGATFALAGKAEAAPVAVTVDPAQTLFPFDGFGGNYCWATDDVVTPYTLQNFNLAWSRHELKAGPWDLQRAAPGPALKEDFERIAGIHKRGIPWIISLWRLPERFYIDPYQKPYSTFGRPVAPDRWEDMLELIGSYLMHLKTNYGAEPDLFSFNEPDLGVSVGFTADAHREANRRIGAHLAKLGLKTRMLLGETANPRDSHKYTLPTAADPEAMRYVGAISFHSWNSGTPEHYKAWADVAAWLQVPLIIGEAGTDPGSYRNRSYDSYHYGLGEAQQTQEILRYARPKASLYWQYTLDYGLVRVGENKTPLPTGRFWLMKHFNNLTPAQSQGVASSSDQKDVFVSAFAKDRTLAVHVLNLGPARAATLSGLPAGDWRKVETTELAGYQETALGKTTPAQFNLPARSLTTWVRADAP